MRSVTRTQLKRLGVDLNPDHPVGSLSVAMQQLVEIARALAWEARYLILDEPTAPLGQSEVRKLFSCLKALKADDVGMVYVTHRLEELAEIADRIVVMRDGSVVKTYDRADMDVSEIVTAMVGRELSQLFPEPATPSQDVALRVQNLTRRPAFESVSFDLHAGEVLGVAGLVGAGRTELVRAIFGADPVDGGVVEVAGRRLRPGSTVAAVRSGLAFVPEDRKGQGVLLQSSIEENLALASLRTFAPRGVLSGTLSRRSCERIIDTLRIKGRPSQKAAMLSGGNQQKVAIGKWLVRRPRVVIFDEPTRGVDVGARAAIYQAIADLTAQGVGVIVVSSELEEVAGLAHRVLVMSRGRVAGVASRAEATLEHLGALATTAVPHSVEVVSASP
jgi:ribose transport system ATP-binding protein